MGLESLNCSCRTSLSKTSRTGTHPTTVKSGKALLVTGGMAVGGVGVLLVVPVVLGTVGFTSGLTAASCAAVAMANGGGDAGVVALLKFAGLAILSAVAAVVASI